MKTAENSTSFKFSGTIDLLSSSFAMISTTPVFKDIELASVEILHPFEFNK